MSLQDTLKWDDGETARLASLKGKIVEVVLTGIQLIYLTDKMGMVARIGNSLSFLLLEPCG